MAWVIDKYKKCDQCGKLIGYRKTDIKPTIGFRTDRFIYYITCPNCNHSIEVSYG